MFLAIVFIVLGLFLLLNAMGVIVGTNFWAFFWAIVFLAVGVKMLMRQGRCPICTGYMWSGRIHEKMHDKMHGECNCGHDHDNDKDGQDHH